MRFELIQHALEGHCSVPLSYASIKLVAGKRVELLLTESKSVVLAVIRTRYMISNRLPLSLLGFIR